MNDENQILPKPPSHPVVTGLLIASVVGAGLNIAIVGQELFSSYLTTDTSAELSKFSAITIAKDENFDGDYYKKDFAGKTVEADLKLDK